MLIRVATILFLVAAILGGSAYFIYELYYKEKKLDVYEQTNASQVAPTPLPDPSVAAFNTLKPLTVKDTPEAREALKSFLEAYPESPKLSEARAALGRINLNILRDPATPGNTLHTVKKGDSLVKIASQLKSTAELICWMNQLPSINLKIGQQLLVPPFNASLVIEREKSTVSIFNNGEFFREYQAVSAKLPASKTEVQSKVIDRVARKGDKRLAFGDEDYPDAEKLVLLSTGGLSIRPFTEPPADGSTPTPTPGIVLSPSDFMEIFVFLKNGSPVTLK